ncbi:lytic transglycosylase domain-containing protein [Moraxella bovoculi]|uniref:lytic transglycosylase domain-containing protein n=1 Tax=Moraxella bovoculi TaxID=386891 RepID=UPI0009B9E1A0|nr:lytic transglycosylase domain-containing protein [Moraxella bovoculi]
MKIKIVVAAAILFFAPNAKACWTEAGQKYDIDPLLLMAIGWKESNGRPNAVGPPLPDGNVALGLMQINTIHLPELRKWGIRRNDLFNPCTSIHVGAYVLRDCINRFGEIWRSVGCYYGGPNSKAYTAMKNYSRDVQKYYASYIQMYRNNINTSAAVMPMPTITEPRSESNPTKRHLEVILFGH